MCDFEDKLRELINCESKENDSDTPDFILAAYISACLDAFTKATCDRDKWHNHVHVDF